MIKVHVRHGFQIGDALCHVHYMKYLCDQHNTGAVVTGDFNGLVKHLIGSNYQFVFVDEADGDFEAEYSLHMAGMLGYYGQCHMAQSFFKPKNEPMPELPLSLTLKSEPCGVQPGIVISPYSHSDMNGNKFWPHDRWLEVVSRLREQGHERFYVVGCTTRNDARAYIEAGVEPYFDQPLSKVLDLLRQSPLLLSIDTGIAHLAHFGGVSKHVLLYPASVPVGWAWNPRGSVVQGWPAQITSKQIADAALKVLGDG